MPPYPGLLGQEEAQSHQAPSEQDQVVPEGGDGIVPVFIALSRPETTLSMQVLGRQDEGHLLDRGTESLSRCLGSRDSARRGSPPVILPQTHPAASARQPPVYFPSL